ncbi:Tropomyosin [Citrus sinensis]|nr:Tropomyosin [Citrus sinensis]
MEEYLQYMKTLRSQMNDVEDQAAKVSVEEQTQISTIQSLENDLVSGSLSVLLRFLVYFETKTETKKFKEDAEKMTMEKGQICAQILEKQRKIASLESDSSTLSQTLELITQERVSISSKLVEKSTYYNKVTEDIGKKLQLQQPELMEMDIKTLEEEHGTLLSDIAGEAEYLQSLQHQIEKLEGISHVIKCACGQEYKVKVSLSA